MPVPSLRERITRDTGNSQKSPAICVLKALAKNATITQGGGYSRSPCCSSLFPCSSFGDEAGRVIDRCSAPVMATKPSVCSIRRNRRDRRNAARS